MESTTHLVRQGKGLPLVRAADSDPDPLLQQTDVGSLSLPLRCSEQAATASFTPAHIKLYFLNEMSLADFWQNHNKKKRP